MQYSIMLLALDEEENLKTLIPLIKAKMFDLDADFEIVVVDGGSKDNTEQVCIENDIRFEFQPAFGYADAFRHGIKTCNGKFIVNLDADHSHSPEFLADLIEKASTDKYDLVIGSRYVEGASFEMSPLRGTLSNILSGVCRAYLGLKTNDCSSGFRIYRKSALEGFALIGEDFSILLNVLTELECHGKSVVEVPFTYKERHHGRSHVAYIKFAISYIKGLVKCRVLADKIRSKISTKKNDDSAKVIDKEKKSESFSSTEHRL